MATEKRLIDANALIGKARRMETTDNNGIPLDTFAVPVLVIVDAPTVDAVPVKHGRWIYEPVEFTYEKDIKCSVCGGYTEKATYFCPNCGSCMDGGSNETY